MSRWFVAHEIDEIGALPIPMEELGYDLLAQLGLSNDEDALPTPPGLEGTFGP